MEVYDIDKEIYEIGKEIFNYLKANFKIYTNKECKQLEKDKGAFGVIYMTQCKVNGKLYIGQKMIDTKDFNTYLGSGKIFKQAVDKYGKDNFERIILEVAYSEEELDKFEIEYIELFDASEEDLFYNIALGGDGGSLKGENNPNYGKHRSEETKKKISEAGRGKHRSEETRKRISESKKGKYIGENNPMYGKHLSEEARNKLSEINSGENHPMYGKHHSKETKKRQSEAKRGKHRSEETRKKIGEANRGKHRSEEIKKKNSEAHKGKKNGNAKLIVCIFPDGRIIKDVCIKELAEELNTSKDTITRVLNSCEPCKPTHKRLKHLEGVIIITQEDYLKYYLNIIKNKFSKAS